jgi:hypothetical protein
MRLTQFCILGILWTMSILCLAREIPAITVVVKIDERAFLDFYRDDIPEAENALAEVLAKNLQSEVPVFTFHTVQEADTLYVTLGRRPGSRYLIDIDFVLELVGKNVKPACDCQPVRWPLSKDGNYADFFKSTVREFVAAVNLQFRVVFKKDVLVADQLQQLTIEKSIYRKISEGWELRYTPRELKLGIDSECRIMQDTDNPDEIPSNYYGKVAIRGEASRICIRSMPLSGYTTPDLSVDPPIDKMSIQILKMTKVVQSSLTPSAGH